MISDRRIYVFNDTYAQYMLSYFSTGPSKFLICAILNVVLIERDRITISQCFFNLNPSRWGEWGKAPSR